MALFGSKKKTFTPIIEEQETKEEIKEIKEPILPQKDEIIKAPSDAALLTGCTNLEGKIEGCGSLVVRGKVNGDIEMDDIVIIDKSANVIGNIRAQKVKIEGQFRGDIFCEVVEITKYGKVEGNIQGNRAYIDGKFSGTTFTKEIIEILNFGKVEAVEFKSETIKIGGELKGKIVASKLLEVQKGGSIEGEIVTKGIKTHEGGRVVGSILTYNESIHSSPQKPTISQEPIKEENKINENIDPEIAKLINISPDDLKKYAPKDKKD